MSTTAYPAGLLGALKRELSTLDKQISAYMEYRTALQHLIELHEEFHGTSVPVPQPTRLRALERPPAAEPSGEAGVAPEDVPFPDESPEHAPDSAPSTVEMARAVLGNAGKPLPLLMIRQAIRETFGIEPAKTLDQMLYKRAQRNKGFFKTRDGEFGLAVPAPEQKIGAAVIESVQVPTTALA